MTSIASRRLDRRRSLLLLPVVIASLTVATVGVSLLETRVGVPNASVVYLAAVVLSAYLVGTPGAILAALGSVVLYDFLFTAPNYTLTISDPGEWLSVTLLLFVGIVVGQLAALQRARTDEARSREHEARALFRISRALATSPSTTAALDSIAQALLAETQMSRIWVVLEHDGHERTVVDTDPGPRPTLASLQHVLQRMPGDEPARWQRIHQPVPPKTRAETDVGLATYRVKIETANAFLGSIWCTRERTRGDPDQTETRLLAAAADQTGQAIARDRLVAESRALEIARQGNELKSALLQSVSHDLRTPLATIRAAAGTMRPRHHPRPEDQEESADQIDREVDYLNRLVTNLLDLSRIDAGAIRVDRDVFELDDIVRRTLQRVATRLAGRPVEIDLLAPPVEVDPTLFDEVVANVLDNAIKYTPDGTLLRIRACPLPGGSFVRLTLEDAGPGVPMDALPTLFDKFYQVPGVAGGSRSGTGIGLAVVRGLVVAMGGRVDARQSDLGGLAIDLDLPRATIPADLDPAES